MAIQKVVVVDGNNLIVRIDRGVAGRSVTDVEPVEISGSLYLVFTFSDGTTETVGPVGTVAYVGQSPIVVTASTISLSTVPVNLGGTGQITANAGFNALAPTQTGNTGKYLKTDGTNSAWDLLDISTADITGTLPIVNGGTGQTTANTGLNALLPVQTGQANKYLQTDGTNTSWDAISLSTADITGVLPVVNGGTGVTTSTGTGSTVLSTSPTLVTPILGTPTSGTLTNATGLPVSTGISGLGTGVSTFLATPTSANLAATVTDETGTGALVFATSPTLVTPALGTPASGVMTNVTGTAAGLTAGNVTTNANLTGMVTSIGNATTVVTNANLTGGVTSVGNATTVVTNANLTGAVTSLGNATSLGSFTSAELATALTDETGTGLAVFATSPTLVTPALGTPSALVGTNITGTASGLTAGNVTTNANLTGMVTSVGNATTVVTNANLTGGVTSVGNATTVVTNANLTGGVTSIGNATTVVTNANLTGDVTSVGNATTLATVATAGVTGSSTAIPVVTINAKGLTTSITTAAVIAPAGTLTGSTLASGVTSSSLTSLGTIGNLSVTAGTIATTPSAATDIANKDYVDTVAQGLDPKASCLAATTIDIILSAPQTIDGIALIAGDRCLVKNQTAQADNGIYVVAAGAWTRSSDMNAWAEVSGAFTFIEQGTTQADTGWVCTSNAGGTLGTTPITFVQFAGVGSYTAGTGLTLTGTQFSLTTPVTVALGGTNSTSAGIGSFNNITGYTASGATGTTSTNLVFSTSPTLVTPILGTPQSATLTNATDLPISTGVSGLGTGVATFLATPSSANLLAAVTDETGTGSLVFANSPTLVTPALGTPSALVGTNITGTAANFNINGTVGATTPSTVTGTTITATTLVVNDNATLGSSNTDTVTFNGRVNTDLEPATDNAYDLGRTGHEWRDLYIDGTANIDSLIADTADINGGTIDATAIGSTTPSSGAFTTVTASTAIGIASGGTGQATANAAFNALAPSQTGNSGKYLTTDGTDTSWALNPLGTVTSVAASVPSFLSIAGSPITTSGTLAISLSGTALPTTSGGTGLTSFTANGVAYASSSSALATGSALTFDGNIFQVTTANGNPVGFSSSSASGTLIQQTNTNASKDLIYRFRQNGGSGNWYDLTMEGSTNNFTFDYNDGTLLTLTNSGHLGLGVTPSSWATVKALQINTTASIAAFTNELDIGLNTYYNAGNKYITTGAATLYAQSAGFHYWYNAPSGTANDTIPFVQAMTLSSAGNLGINFTPSATGSNAKALQLTNYGTLSGNGSLGFMSMAANAYESADNSWNRVNATSAGRYQISYTGEHSWYYTGGSIAGSAIAWTQAMTLSSVGYLGIADTNPAYPLTVGGNAQLGSDSNTPTVIIGKATPTVNGDAGIQFRHSNITKNWSISSNRYSSSGLEFTPSTTNGGTTYTTPVMVLDTSGNLGLGAVPSAWATVSPVMQFPAGGFIAAQGSTNTFYVGSNHYFNGGSFIYTQTGFATQYQCGGNNGSHSWRGTSVSGSGGAIAAIGTFMTLDANGNLGLGDAAPSAKANFIIYKAPVSYAGLNATAVFSSTTSQATGVGGLIAFEGQYGSGDSCYGAIGGLKENSTSGNYAGYLALYSRANGSLPTERARITSGGFLKASNSSSYLNTTGPFYEFTSDDTVTSQSFIFYNSNTNINQAAMFFLGANRNTTNNTFYYFGCYNYQSSSYKLVIADSGNVTNTNNSYGAISDVKLKENIVDASPKLADLMQVKVRSYNMIGNTTKQLGVVAQELETIFPAMVEQALDTERVTTTDENGKEVITDVSTGTYTKSVKYSVFVPMLIKAMQEQQAIIESLKARLDAANL